MAIVALWFRDLIFDPGFLGLRDDWPIPPTSWQNVQRAIQAQSAWIDNYFGVPGAERNMGSYIVFGWGLIARFLGADGWLISRYSIAFIALAAIFAYQPARVFGMRRHAAFAVGFTYASTPFFFDAFITGYSQMFVGMAALPKALASAHLAFERPFGIRRFLKGMVWIGLSPSTIHLAFLSAATIAGYCAYRIVLTPGRVSRKLITVGYVVAMGSGILFFHPAAAIVTYQWLFIPGAIDQLGVWAENANITWVSAVAPRFSEAFGLVGSPYNYSVGEGLQNEPLSFIYVVGRAALTGFGFLAIVITRGRERRLAAFFLAIFLLFHLARERIQRAVIGITRAISGHSGQRTV